MFKVGDNVRHKINPATYGVILEIDPNSDHPYHVRIETGIVLWFRADVWELGNGINIGATVVNGNIKGTLVGISGGDYPLEVELSPGLKGKFKLEDWKLYDGFTVGDKVVFTKNLVGCESDVSIGEELTIHEIDDSESLSHACVDKYGMIRWFSKEELELKK